MAKDFNPRSPHGERHRILSNMRQIEAISIHAPRTGSDKPAQRRKPRRYKFQSTLPARGATLTYSTSAASMRFQSTLPARGATNQDFT